SHAAQKPRPVPLYSAPTRPTPVGMAVVRAQLWDDTAQSPAAYAMLEAQTAGHKLARSFADAAGRVALFFPYPEPIDFVVASPINPTPLGVSTPYATHSWLIQLNAAYSPQARGKQLPDLCTVLSQRTATLWAD